MENNKLNIAKSIIANVSRIIVGLTFIFSGFVKAVDPLGFQYKIQDYLEAFGIGNWFPDIFSLLGGISLSTIEFSLGVFMLLGIRKHIATTFSLILMAFMTPLTLFIAILNPVPDCGCFGDALVVTNWQTFWKNIVLLILTYYSFRWRKSIISFISAKTDWMVSIYTILFAIFLSFYCLYYLPIFDFRPFKIGVNISESMSIPENAKPSVYETVFTLEKDGEKKEFTIDNYPDASWTFLDAKTVLKEKGYDPTITDFSLRLQDTGEDITDSILANENYTFLLVANRLEKADDSNIDLINEIYDYAVEHGYDFYGLTSSTDELIDDWRDRTGAEYPFLLVDDIVLKTMIRSNPGLLLIKNGTIYQKWNDSSIPNEYDLKGEPLERIEVGQLEESNILRKIGVMCLWFFIPLFIILAIDFLFVRRKQLKEYLLNKKNKDLSDDKLTQ